MERPQSGEVLHEPRGGDSVKLLKMTAFVRRRRLVHLLNQAEEIESKLLNVVAEIVELTEEGDALHVSMRQLLEALDQ